MLHVNPTKREKERRREREKERKRGGGEERRRATALVLSEAKDLGRCHQLVAGESELVDGAEVLRFAQEEAILSLSPCLFLSFSRSLYFSFSL
jgi:hypothetical protein